MKRFRSILTSLSCGTFTTLAFVAFPAQAVETDGFDKGMRPVLSSYLKIQETLAADSVDGIDEAARSIAEDTAVFETGSYPEHYRDLPVTLRNRAEALSKSTSLEAARDAFKKLSRPMAMWGTISQPAGIDVLFCSTANASWLQKHGEVRNPYYGKSMLACGQVTSEAGHPMHSMNKDAHHGGGHPVEPMMGGHDDAPQPGKVTNQEHHRGAPAAATTPSATGYLESRQCGGRGACGGT